MHPGFVLLVVAVVAVAVVVAWLGRRAEAKRRAALAAFAVNNGWRFVDADDSYCTRWHGPPFDAGDHRRARNVLAGTHRGRPMVAFDYSYQTHSTDSQGHRHTTTHSYTVCTLGLPAPVPGLSVTPESLLTRVGEAFGFSDIQLESEDFNRRFRVRAPDPKFAYDVLSPRTMQLLLSRPAERWRIEGDTILCWDTGRAEPVAVLDRLSLLSAVVEGIPDYVWRDRGATTGGPA